MGTHALSAKASGCDVTSKKAPNKKKRHVSTMAATVTKGKSMSEGIVRKTAHLVNLVVASKIVS